MSFIVRRLARLPSALLLGTTLMLAQPAHPQVYAGVAENGSIVLSNFRSAQVQQLVTGDEPPTRDVEAKYGPGGTRLTTHIERAATESELPAGLLHAVIAVESGFNARAISPKGAQGLMQLMPATARGLGVTDPFDPEQNVRAGATHLKSLMTRFNNDLELALAAYNAGADAVIKAGYRIPPIAETRAYVPRVLAQVKRFEGSITGSHLPASSARPTSSAPRESGAR